MSPKISKILAFFAALFLLGAAAVFLAPRLLEREIRAAVEKALPGGTVKLGKLSLERPWALAVSDIEVRSKDLDVSAAQVRVGFDRNVDVLSPSITVRALPAADAKSGGGAPPVRAVRVRDLTLHYKAGGITADVTGGFEYDAAARKLSNVDLAMPSFKQGELSVKNAALRTGADGTGSLTAAEISRQKLKITEISAKAAVGPEGIVLSELQAAFVGGKLTGSASAYFSAPPRFALDVSADKMDLAVLGADLALEAKVGLGGRIDGRIAVTGEGGKLTAFSGMLNGTENGGDVVINDRATLETLAKNVKQPVELVESAFKEYHFTTAGAALRLEDGNLGLDVHMEGEKGKRDLAITLHDFL